MSCTAVPGSSHLVSAKPAWIFVSKNSIADRSGRAGIFVHVVNAERQHLVAGEPQLIVFGCLLLAANPLTLESEHQQPNRERGTMASPEVKGSA